MTDKLLQLAFIGGIVYLIIGIIVFILAPVFIFKIRKSLFSDKEW